MNRPGICISAVICGVLLAARPGMAADLPRPAPSSPPQPVPNTVPTYNWTGFYFGAHVGYGWSDTSASVFGVSAPALGTTPGGVTAGAQLGFDWQIAGGLVIGLEADGSWANMKESFSVPSAPLTLVSQVDWFGTVRPKLGYAIGDVLVYATGGLAWAFNQVGLEPSIADTPHVHVGWSAGAGVEYRLAPNWGLRIEYLYSDLGRQAIEFVYDGPQVVNSDLRLSTLQAGINFRF